MTKIKIRVRNIPQDTEYRRSFNVLVPLDIQGKEGILVEDAKPPNTVRGSVSAYCLIEGNPYYIPSWSFEKIARITEVPFTFDI